MQKSILSFSFLLMICFTITTSVTSCDQFIGDNNKTPETNAKTEAAVEKKAEKTVNSPLIICDWHGNFFPICENILEGWGWENNESCIGSITCENTGGISLDISNSN